MVKYTLKKDCIRKRLISAVIVFIFHLIPIFAMTSTASSDPKIKKPNVSGQFYEADPKRLSANIDKYISQANNVPSEKRIDILIAPHAGYMYSGGVAAYGFKAVSRQAYKTIVILAPSHFTEFDGISIWDEGGFETPLGVADVDNDFAKTLMDKNKDFYFLPEAFSPEHSLEVEIPFLQKIFDDIKIVPVIMGQPSYALLGSFAAALKETIGDRKDVLIVVSTDLSHYHDDAFARKIDAHTIDAVKNLKAEQVWKECRLRSMEMCGFVPVTAALLYAKSKGLTDTEVLRYAHSGDVSGDNKRVVGYTSIVFYSNGGNKPDYRENAVSALNMDQKRELVRIARATVESYVRNGQKLDVQTSDQRLTKEEGAFVTINKHDHLRGCIGNIIGRQPLYITVRDMAVAAASQDPRFPPVTVEELNEIDVEVSVLSKPRIIKDVNEIELGEHGVIISRGITHSGVFLPQVADETGWTKEEFLTQLCSQKARLPGDCWKDPNTKIEVFTADVFDEKDVK